MPIYPAASLKYVSLHIQLTNPLGDIDEKRTTRKQAAVAQARGGRKEKGKKTHTGKHVQMRLRVHGIVFLLFLLFHLSVFVIFPNSIKIRQRTCKHEY